MPYREVTQSGPLMIAFNYGILPIVSDLGGFKEHITDNINGFLFKSESSNDLAKVMEKTINLSEDQRWKIKKGLCKYVDYEFDLARITKKYIDFFNAIIERNQIMQDLDA